VAGLVISALTVVGGCALTVEGKPVAVSEKAVPTTAPHTSVPTKPSVALEEHAVDDECVLTGAQISTLTGVSLDNGQPTRTKRSDGTWGQSCTYYLTEGGILSFTASIKVMRPKDGPVTDDVIASITRPGARSVPGVGRALLVEAKPEYPQSCLATDKFVATIFLVGSNLPSAPTDERWIAAAQEIIAKLPS
jgi:hypothetical protein